MVERNAPEPLGFEPAPRFDPVAEAKHLLRTVRSGALATLDRETGSPVCSLVTVATDLDGSPLLLLSALAAHAGNLDADGRASLLLAPGGRGDPLAHPRLTLVGRVDRCTEPRIRSRFLRRHPKAALYADFPDFTFRRFAIESASLNGGFARAARLRSDEIGTAMAGAEGLAASEEGAVAHMNADHADAIALYATRLAGAGEGPWQATGCDPEGIDMAAGDRTARVLFPERATAPGDLRRILVALAAEARSRP